MRRSVRAFTLIELMAVVVIASLVTAMGAIGIGGVMRQTQFQRTVAGFMQMDVRARLHARMGGVATQMVIDPLARKAKVVEVATDTDAIELSRVELPFDVAVTLELPREVPSSNSTAMVVTFDRLGCSIDYAVQLRDGVSGRRLEVSGLTGSIRAAEVTP